jgi:hypothetical protein
VVGIITYIVVEMNYQITAPINISTEMHHEQC